MKSDAPSPATKETPTEVNGRVYEPWITKLAEKIFEWADGYYLHNSSLAFGGWKLADLIFEHAPKAAETPLLAKQLSREYNFTSQEDQCQAMRMGAELFGAGFSQGRDAGAKSVVAAQNLRQEVVAKLTRRAAFLRKSFGENPATLACLAEELERQAKEISDMDGR